MTICGHLMFACDDGTRSASSVFFHFIKNIRWPLESVAPASKINNLCSIGLCVVWFWGENGMYREFFQVQVLDRSLAVHVLRVPSFSLRSISLPVQDCCLFVCVALLWLCKNNNKGRWLNLLCRICGWSVNIQVFPLSTSFFFCASSNAWIKSGQSKFSSGSHVLSESGYPFHFK